MRRLFICLCVLAACHPVTSHAANAFVSKSTTGSCTTVCPGATISTGALSVSAGNTAIVTIAGYNNSTTMTITSVTDTALNTYQQGSGCVYSAQGTVVGIGYVWYAKNITANAADVAVVTYSDSGSQFRSATLFQYSGVDTTAPFELCATGVGVPTATTVTSSSFSPAASGNLNFAYVVSNNSNTWTADANYVERMSNGDSQAEDRVTAPSGAQTTAYGYNDNASTVIMVVASFKVLGGAPTYKPQSLTTLGVPE